MFRLRMWQGVIAVAIAGAMLAPQYAAAQELTYKVTTAPMHKAVTTVSIFSHAAQPQANTAVPEGGALLNSPWFSAHSIPANQVAALAHSIPAAKVKIPKIKRPPTLATFSSPIGFPGVDAYDNYEANPFEVEPPDQGLCVGDGYVIELTNTTAEVFPPSGPPVITSLYEIFNVSAGNGPNYNLLTDPRCVYDPSTQNFYVSASYIAGDGLSSALMIGVANTHTTTVYPFPTSNLVGDSGCTPCIMDEPMLGLNSTSLFIASNEFSLSSGNFNQDLIIVFSKPDLDAGGTPPPANPVIFYNIGYKYKHVALPAFGISPAFSPAADYDTDNGGTEFALASLEGLIGTIKKVALLAITGTCAFPSNTGTPCSANVAAGAKLVGNKKYMDPIYASLQKPGDYPLGQDLGAAEPQLDTGDARMQQVVYSGGKLYSSLTTAVQVGGNVQAGVLWMWMVPKVKVTKKTHAGNSSPLYVAKVHGAKFHGGYLGLPGLDLFDPSIAVNSSGTTTVAFDMSGSTIFPSVGYANVMGSTDKSVHMVVQGIGPDDGATAYTIPAIGLTGNGIGRWGDYTAIVPDESGNFWMGGEYIGQTCTQSVYNSDNTCSSTRAQYTNWGTWIAELTQ